MPVSVSTNNDAVDSNNNGILGVPAMDSQLSKCFTWIFFISSLKWYHKEDSSLVQFWR